ncbi:MAG: transposase [Candidatus Omnitrophota bacterium]
MPKLPTRRSIRLPGYNYSTNGAYYITICANNRKCIFGEVKNTKCVGAGLAPAHNKTIELSIIGGIIDKQWRNIPNQFENTNIYEYVIMPNHFHGIIIIQNEGNKRAAARAAPTYLGQIIGSFKSKCVVDCLKYIRINNLNLSAKIWQRSLYDHIIRNDKSLNNIRQYICNNPATWDSDMENPHKKGMPNNNI